MSDDPTLVRRAGVVLRADPSRVIAKLFLPGQELVGDGVSRAAAVIGRSLAMSEAEVRATLDEVYFGYSARHHDLRELFDEHFAVIADRVVGIEGLSAERRNLIGAYCTQEFAVEAAALFNPSMVPHPDQSDLRPGELRFVMSVRAVGEGHISSIEFRTGVVTSDSVVVHDPGRRLVTGHSSPSMISSDFLRDALAERPDRGRAEAVLQLLPPVFGADQLQAALAAVDEDPVTANRSRAVIERVREIAAGQYRLTFRPDRPLAERVIYPTSPAERQGMEDARFVRFADDDGRVSYRGTYTAFDGAHISPRLISTQDFRSFDVSQLIGPAAKDKGMALFPRRIGGRYFALARWDRENIGLAISVDALRWEKAAIVAGPDRPWQLIQLGNCGSPIETPFGWLVLTHGVGPMRTYGIGAMLLDLDDPTLVLGTLRDPILTATEDERDGYVPNVVYSCGALQLDGTLVVPYGCSDSSIRFAFVDLSELLSRLVSPGVPAAISSAG